MALWLDPFAPLLTPLQQTAAFLPPVDVTVSDSDLVLTMDLPGLTVDDVEIELTDGFLTVRGERKRPEVAEGGSFITTERPYGRFERQITVPEGVDPESITASLDNGVLSLIVPQPQQKKAKTITINSASEQRELETANA